MNESSHLNQINVILIRISNERANKWQNLCGKKSIFYCTHSDETQTLPMNRDEESEIMSKRERERKTASGWSGKVDESMRIILVRALKLIK